jgi:hypothetical protein
MIHRPAPVNIPTSVSEILFDMLAPYAYADTENDDALFELCQGIGAMFNDFGVARDELMEVGEDVYRIAPGFSQIIDIDRVPESYLDWLAQFVGVRILPSITLLAEKKAYVQGTPSQLRGGPDAMVDAVKRTLTGTKTVFMIERQGSAWRLAVTTLSSETPDPSLTAYVAGLQKPAGVIMTVSQITGGNYAALLGTHTDYNDVTASFTDYNDVVTDPTQ